MFKHLDNWIQFAQFPPVHHSWRVEEGARIQGTLKMLDRPSFRCDSGHCVGMVHS